MPMLWCRCMVLFWLLYKLNTENKISLPTWIGSSLSKASSVGAVFTFLLVIRIGYHVKLRLSMVGELILVSVSVEKVYITKATGYYLQWGVSFHVSCHKPPIWHFSFDSDSLTAASYNYSQAFGEAQWLFLISSFLFLNNLHWQKSAKVTQKIAELSAGRWHIK